MNSQYVTLGDSLEVLKSLPSNSVDAVITDPPYGLSDHDEDDVRDCLRAWLAGEEYKTKKRGYYGSTWDSWVPGPELWKEVLRVAKPGAYIVCFAGTRTQDLMSVALRLGGWHLRDTLIYGYTSGFPKSHNVAAAIDKHLGHPNRGKAIPTAGRTQAGSEELLTSNPVEAYVARSEEAKGYEDKGSALKPAYEPILLARKALNGTMATNVLEYGTGPLHIDQTRISEEGEEGLGRWPANLVFEESAVEHLNIKNAQRYFFTTKAARKEKEAGLDDFEVATVGDGRKTAIDNAFQRGKTERKNTHTTVKPIDLMRWLCKLITPAGGIILDPFAGSGTTGCAAVLDGFHFQGIEISAEYARIAEARIEHWYNQR